MRYRQLGKTGLMVSEIGLGGEWLEQQSASDVKKVIDRCKEYGINILDCWMSGLMFVQTSVWLLPVR